MRRVEQSPRLLTEDLRWLLRHKLRIDKLAHPWPAVEVTGGEAARADICHAMGSMCSTLCACHILHAEVESSVARNVHLKDAGVGLTVVPRSTAQAMGPCKTKEQR